MADGCLEVSIAADLLMHRARSHPESYLVCGGGKVSGTDVE